jgi:hypothetical protein
MVFSIFLFILIAQQDEFYLKNDALSERPPRYEFELKGLDREYAYSRVDLKQNKSLGLFLDVGKL